MLNRLQSYGFRLKVGKCAFMADSVEYLGHTVDANGLHATSDKLKAITDAPTPKNVRVAIVLGTTQPLWEVHSQSGYHATSSQSAPAERCEMGLD